MTTPQQYDQQLTAAGYGLDARQRYIDDAPDPEYAECHWDNTIVPAAEASGEIPEPPVMHSVGDDLADRQNMAQRKASEEWYARHPGLAPWDMTTEQNQQYDEFTTRRMQQILHEPEIYPDDSDQDIEL
ncbi:hypothetical protein [Streptomyces sp. G-5]|uniref:hypothetical protein n=1 Tax=Streptomyces sp. G-5 TaxID=2977231 RepID=UPI0021D2ED0E|nr:hypothetical protein [Streptomyces sp. G-5]MCU4750296.1 hypothetical protein [Streptomyces sp. G-5]